MTQQILEYRAPRRPSEICTIVYLRTALFGFTTLLLVTGLCLLGLGVYSLVEQYYIWPLLPFLHRVSVYGLTSSGALVLLAAIVGCYGTTKENHRTLIAYSVLLVLIFLCEAAVGGLSYYVYTLMRQGSLSSHLNLLVSEQWGKDSGITTAIDRIQQDYGCCGISNHSDWLTNPVIASSSKKAPDSCCISPLPNCGRSDHKSNLHHQGCGDSLLLNTNYTITLILIPAVTLGFTVTQIVGVIFSCALSRRIVHTKKIIRNRKYFY